MQSTAAPLQLFEEFIDERQFLTGLSNETIRGYKSIFQHFLNLMPEIVSVDFMTPEMLTEFFKRLQTRERLVGRSTVKVGVRKATIKTYWSKLHAYFEWLKAKGAIQYNPLHKLKAPELVQVEDRAISEEDVRKLYAAVTLYSKNTLVLRRNIVMLSLLLLCGLRLGEFISLEIRDFDLEKKLVTVRSNTSKSGKTRIIPLHPTLLFHLREYIKERNKNGYKTQYLLVSNNSSSQLTRHGLKHWVNRLSRQSGVKFHLHQFRHAFARNLAYKDVHAVKIQKLLGHSNLNMTMTYLSSIKSEDLSKEISLLSL